jgi:hypothetical protein
MRLDPRPSACSGPSAFPACAAGWLWASRAALRLALRCAPDSLPTLRREILLDLAKAPVSVRLMCLSSHRRSPTRSACQPFAAWWQCHRVEIRRGIGCAGAGRYAGRRPCHRVGGPPHRPTLALPVLSAFRRARPLPQLGGASTIQPFGGQESVVFRYTSEAARHRRQSRSEMLARGRQKIFETDPALFRRTPFPACVSMFGIQKIAAFRGGARGKFSKSKKGGWGVPRAPRIPREPGEARTR